MRRISLIILILSMPLIALCQRSPEEQAIMESVVNVFKGMADGDSAMVRKSFLPDARLVSIGKDEDGNLQYNNSELTRFLNAVGTPHEQTWNEPIWGVKISVDGNLAQVWASYAFYLGKEFLHCGVDAFHLVKTADGWKIIHLADTRQKEGCNVPIEIKNRYK
jgi:hypothetical protein